LFFSALTLQIQAAIFFQEYRVVARVGTEDFQ
jgi:hypothetical protein